MYAHVGQLTVGQHPKGYSDRTFQAVRSRRLRINGVLGEVILQRKITALEVDTTVSFDGSRFGGRRDRRELRVGGSEEGTTAEEKEQTVHV